MSTMFAIHATFHYYSGMLNRPKSGLIRDDAGDVLTFSSHDAASRHIRLLEPSEHYRLQYGEYSPPSFRVRKYTR